MRLRSVSSSSERAGVARWIFVLLAWACSSPNGAATDSSVTTAGTSGIGGTSGANPGGASAGGTGGAGGTTAGTAGTEPSLGSGNGGALSSGGSGGVAQTGGTAGLGAGGTTAGNAGAGTAGIVAGGAAGQAGGGGDAQPAGGTSGNAGSSEGGAAGVTTDGNFTLLYRDDFDTLDASRWELMTHSWTGNLALFSAESVSVAGSELMLELLPAPASTTNGGETKSFLGAEVRSRDTLTYGRVKARARLARGSAVVSALVTIYTPWPADDWNELDIECLGAEPANVQFNAMVYTGPPTTPPVTQSVTPTQHPQKVDLGFDPSANFHVYTIEWTPSGARFLVDEQERHAWSERIELMTLPQNVLLTIWASSSAEWAGPVTAQTTGASATYDWIELYRYAP